MWLVTVLFLLLVDTVFSMRCSEGSVIVDLKGGKKCLLYGNCKKRFNAADNHCRSLNGNLISIHDAVENTVITGKLNEFFIEDLWIGINNKSGNGLIYNENGQKVGYSNVKSTKESGNGCISLDKKGDWYNDRCCSKKFFVCDLPPVNGGQEGSGATNPPNVQQTQPTTTTTVTTATPANSCLSVKVTPLYRNYQHALMDHFYTANLKEHQDAVRGGWAAETQMGFIGADKVENCPDLLPLYRCYKQGASDHFYTTDKKEFDNALAQQYDNEGITGYCMKTPGPCRIPLYRFYSAGLRDHFYTMDENEKNVVQSQGRYAFEGIQCYIWKSTETC